MARLRGFTGLLVLGVVAAVPAAGEPPAYKLKELQPGAGSSYPTDFTEFQGADDPAPRTYFHASYASPGPGLWKTDGSDAGTVLVTTSQTISNMYETLVVGGKLFFSSAGLWVSDGTDAGTVAIPNSGRIPERFFDAGGGRLVFASDPDGTGWDLYVSDGVTATAYPAYDNPSRFTAYAGRVLFRTYDDRLILFDAATGAGVVVDTQVGGFAVHGGSIYYNKGGAFYRSDGTPGAGAKISDQGGGSYTSLGPDLFFVSCTTELGTALYKWDGSAISLVADPVPGNACDNLQDLEGPEQLIVRLGKLFFVADDGVHGKEIWVSDGTPMGTRLVKDIHPGIASSGPYGMLLDDLFCEDERCAVEWGGVFYFSADDGVRGESLWRTDGTEAGTVLAQDFSTRNTYSMVGHLGIAGSRLYLAAGDGFPNVEPWVLPLTPTVFAPPARVAEGTGGTPRAAVTVSLEPPAASPVSVSWSTADDTAIAGSDYTAASGTLTFAPGGPPQTIFVPLVGDPDVEPDERLFVDLSSASVAVGTSRVAVTLRNDDGPVMSVSDITVPESGARSFTVTLSAPSAQDVTVNWAIEEETATPSINGPDYSASPLSGTLTFTPGQVSKTIPFTVTADTRDEENETFFLRLTNAAGADMPIDFVRATITDDDGPPSVSVSSNASANEGGPTSRNKVTFSIPLTGLTGKPVQVCYATSDGTATAGIDYVAQHGCLTPNNVSVTATVDVPIIGDNVDEAAETFFLTLSDPVNATITTAQRQGTINNDDAARLSVSPATVAVTEGAAGTTTPVTVAVVLNNPSSFTVTVDYATAPGTTNPATTGVDYTGVSGTLSFPPGTTSHTVPVSVIGDDVDEGTSETFFLNLSNATNATIQAPRTTVTITDDDVARFAVGDVSVVEGDSGNVAVTLTVSLGSAYKTDSSVKYYTSNGSATVAGGDFVGISNGVAAGAVLLSFPAGTVSQQVTVEVIGDTTREASNEYFNFNLTGASGGPTVVDGQARVTILDDDLLATDRRLSIAPKAASVTEPDSGQTPVSFTVSLIPASGATPTPSGLPVTVSLVAGGTASAPSDYTGVPASLTFAPGTTTQTVTAAVQADSVLENPEAAILTLANPTNATIAPVSTTTSGSATLNIYDAVSRAPRDFYTVDPCRVVDTRDPLKGGPNPVATGSPRTFVIGGVCGVPPTARAVSVNVTVAGATATGNLRVYPGGTGLPSTSTVNYAAGQTRANNAIVLLGDLANLAVAVAPSGTVHVIIDVNGYME